MDAVLNAKFDANNPYKYIHYSKYLARMFTLLFFWPNKSVNFLVNLGACSPICNIIKGIFGLCKSIISNPVINWRIQIHHEDGG